MIRPNDRGQVPIIYIMLNNRPPTLFFSVNDRGEPLCPPIF